ncbi:MAG: aspartate carbamoyltransferase [Euryarchaeota archaeon RBG_19FT_COMBO_56_21]|nr:MAG: aspartate carbamoyltransferase [Euryarchaeota archaeon RBG_19FT_COMBO_56_21]
MSAGWKGMDIVSIRDFSREQIEHVLKLADKMVPVAKGEERSVLLEGHVLGSLFYEPSTRTRLSFECAMTRLGGRTLGFDEPKGSSVAKGETLADTIRMVDSYCDVIVLRHPQEGAARLAAHFANKPVINAGDGAGQHPTQTMLDLFTIRKEKKNLEGINVVVLGDLKYGRTVHSLSEALAMFGAQLTFVAPPSLQIPKEHLKQIETMGHKPKISSSLEDSIKEADVLYVTRIQKERFPDPAEYQKVAGTFRIDLNALKDVKRDMIIMHPLPRVGEIAPEVDATEHARYFEQAFNGVPVRMALLGLVLGASK